MPKNRTDLKQLSAKQVLALEQLTLNADVEAVARAVKVSKTTIYKWLQKDHFRTKLIEKRSILLDENIDKIKTHCDSALKKIVKLMESNNESMVFKSASYLLDKALQVKELQELQERLEQLEQTIKEVQENENQHQ